MCAGESGQKDAARRRHLLQAPATPLQLPLTGIGEPPARACMRAAQRDMPDTFCMAALVASQLLDALLQVCLAKHACESVCIWSALLWMIGFQYRRSPVIE